MSDTGSDVVDAGPDGYTGPVGTAYGTVFAMAPPGFSPFKSAEAPSLEKPATVSIHAHGIRWNSEYDPTEGFRLEDVPTGYWAILVEDIDDGNDLLPSIINGVVSQNQETLWEVPAIKRSTLTDVYGSLPTPLEIDPTRAQLLVTVVDCSLLGGMARSGFHLNIPSQSSGVVYDSGPGWQLNAPEGTGPLGVAIVANVLADDYPGGLVTLSWEIDGQTGTTDAVRTIRGAVTRVYFALPC